MTSARAFVGKNLILGRGLKGENGGTWLLEGTQVGKNLILGRGLKGTMS